MNLIELIQTILKNKKNIILIVAISTVMSIALSYTIPKEYKVQTAFVANSQESVQGGTNKLSGLASLAGINLPSGSQQEILSPFLYPKLVRSVPFQKAILNQPVLNLKTDDSLTYNQFSEEYMGRDFLSTIKRYTLGLPSMLLKSRSNQSAAMNPEMALTLADKMKIEGLRKRVNLTVNEIDGVLTLTCKMPDPSMAFHICNFAAEKLQSRISEIKLNKSMKKLRFTERLLEEKKRDFEEIQLRLAHYRDANLSTSTALMKEEEQKLITEYNLKFELYREIASQLETQKIRVKEETPSFTILEPIIYPVERFSPKRKLFVITGMFFGLILSIAWVFFVPLLSLLRKDLKITK